VQQIAATITRHQRLTGNSPLVMVDCLQLLAPHDPRASDQHNRDKAVLELKRVSRDHKTPVVVISSPDRHNSGNQVIAGFQSGATAAAADVILELQVRETPGQDGLEGNAVLKPGVSRVELRIRENRWGATGLSIEYDYYPLFNCFVEGK
jgi:replicative DNA helicase